MAVPLCLSLSFHFPFLSVSFSLSVSALFCCLISSQTLSFPFQMANSVFLLPQSFFYFPFYLLPSCLSKCFPLVSYVLLHTLYCFLFYVCSLSLSLSLHVFLFASSVCYIFFYHFVFRSTILVLFNTLLFCFFLCLFQPQDCPLVKKLVLVLHQSSFSCLPYLASTFSSHLVFTQKKKERPKKLVYKLQSCL